MDLNFTSSRNITLQFVKLPQSVVRFIFERHLFESKDSRNFLNQCSFHFLISGCSY